MANTSDPRFRPPLYDEPKTFGQHDAYPPPRPTAELEAVDLRDREAILALELELHNESQPSRRAAIIQLHFDRIKATAAPQRKAHTSTSPYDLDAIARDRDRKRRQRR